MLHDDANKILQSWSSLRVFTEGTGGFKNLFPRSVASGVVTMNGHHGIPYVKLFLPPLAPIASRKRNISAHNIISYQANQLSAHRRVKHLPIQLNPCFNHNNKAGFKSCQLCKCCYVRHHPIEILLFNA
jgi:hypothetical protein